MIRLSNTITISLFLILSCTTNSKIDLINYIDHNADIIIRSSSSETLLSDLNQMIFNHNTLKLSDSEAKSIKQTITNSKIDSTIYLSIFRESTIKFQIIGRHKKATLDSLLNSKSSFNKNKLQLLDTTPKDSLWLNNFNSFKIITNSKNYSAFKDELKTDSTLGKLIDRNNHFIYIKGKTFSNEFVPKSISSVFKGDSFISLDDFENKIYINGIITYNDSLSSLFKSLERSKNYSSKIASIAPDNSEFFTSISFDSFKDLDSLFTSQKIIKSNNLADNLFSQTTEFGIIKNGKQSALTFNYPSNTILENEISEIINYRGFEVFQINNKDLTDISNQIINPSEYIYGVFIEEFLIISDNKSYLKEIILFYINQETLSFSQNYSNLLNDLSDEATVLLYSNKNIIESNDNNSKNFASILQIVNNGKFYHSHLIIAQNKTQTKIKRPEAFLNIKLDLPILKFQYLTNHITKSKDLLIQDINFNLHRFNHKGEKLWSLDLKNELLGNCFEVDIFKNGRIQTAFATSKAIHIIDARGRNVNGFPVKVNQPITQPLSVFDYENTKNYRFLITQKNALVMFNSKGQRVKGFDYDIEKEITSQPKHFRISNKDYIAFSTSDKLKIISRTGNDRIQIKEALNIIPNSIFKNNNHILFNENNKYITKINTKGQVSRNVLPKDLKTNIYATNKSLVSLTENKLTIKGKQVILDYGNYTPPKITYINDKLFFTTTDLQSQKIFLFNSKAQPIDGFPVFGTSECIIEDIDNDSSLELSVLGEANQIIVYKFN